MTAIVDDPGLRGSARRPHNQAIFARAQRHSRLVRRLRIVLPVLGIAVFSTVLLVSYLDPMRILARLPTDSGRLAVSGTKIIMESPKLAGFTKDNRPYELNARQAAQDITNPDVVELSDLRAKMESKDNTSITLTAVEGLYNRKSGQLNLNRDVLLSTTSYQVNLQEAQVDTTTNNVISNQPVQVKMLQGTVRSNRLEVEKGGEVVRFIGDVKMTIDSLGKEDQQVTWSGNAGR